nr:RNA polymerase sigma factor [Actinoplanes sp. M2I2]
MAAAAEQDRGAFAELYERYAPWLVAKLRYRSQDQALIDDVVQETFLSVWRGKARYSERADGDVAGWLWRVASRRLVDAIRGESSLHRLRTKLSRALTGDESSAEDQVLLDVGHGRLGHALEQLSPELRAVMQATVLDGLSVREAATVLGIPAGTVKTRAMRARKQLRRDLAWP